MIKEETKTKRANSCEKLCASEWLCIWTKRRTQDEIFVVKKCIKRLRKKNRKLQSLAREANATGQRASATED